MLRDQAQDCPTDDGATAANFCGEYARPCSVGFDGFAGYDLEEEWRITGEDHEDDGELMYGTGKCVAY